MPTGRVLQARRACGKGTVRSTARWAGMARRAAPAGMSQEAETGAACRRGACIGPWRDRWGRCARCREAAESEMQSFIRKDTGASEDEAYGALYDELAAGSDMEDSD